MGLHGRGSRPGLVFAAPSRGALFDVMGLILHQFWEKSDRSSGISQTTQVGRYANAIENSFKKIS